MGVVSNTEAYFLATGKTREYSDLVANNCETISVVIPKGGTQRIYLSQNSLLDNRVLTAIEVVTQGEQIYGYNPNGTTIENIPTSSLPLFLFTLGKDNNEIIKTPFSSMHRPSQNGKFYFINSEVGRHRIGDSFIDQIGAGTYGSYIITLRFWYN